MCLINKFTGRNTWIGEYLSNSHLFNSFFWGGGVGYTVFSNVMQCHSNTLSVPALLHIQSNGVFFSFRKGIGKGSLV